MRNRRISGSVLSACAAGAAILGALVSAPPACAQVVGNATRRPIPTTVTSPGADWSAIPDLFGLRSETDLTPYQTGPGVAVADPDPIPEGGSSEALAAGAARWLQQALSAQPKLERSPSYTGTAHVFSRLHPHPQPSPAEARAVSGATGATHLLTVEVTGGAANTGLTLRLFRLPEGQPVGSAVALRGGPSGIVSGLPGAVNDLCKTLGVTAVPVAAPDTAEDLTYLGSLPRSKGAVRDPGRLHSLAAHSTLAALSGITLSGTANDMRGLDSFLRPLAAREANNPVAVAAAGWGIALGRASLITLDLPDVALRLQQKYPHTYLACLAASQMSTGADSPAEAVAMAQEAVRCSPGNPESWRALGSTISDQAGALRHGAVWYQVPESNRSILVSLYVRWAQYADQEVKLDPRWSDAWLDVAQANTFAGNTRKAADAFWNSLRSNHGSTTVYSWGFEMFNSKWDGNPLDLQRMMEAAAVDQYPDPASRVWIARMLTQNGRPDLAAQVVHTAGERQTIRQLAQQTEEANRAEAQAERQSIQQEQEAPAIPGSRPPAPLTDRQREVQDTIAQWNASHGGVKTTEKPEPVDHYRVAAYTLETAFQHSGPVYGLAFSPDGSRLACAGHGHEIQIRTVSAHATVTVLHDAAGSVYGVAWSPDGRKLATAGSDGAVRIWDTGTGQVIRTLSGHAGPVRAVAWRAQGSLLASAGDDGTIRLWDPATGTPGKVLRDGDVSVGNIAFDPSGQRLASASGLGGLGTVRIWNVATGAASQTIPVPLSLMDPLAWSPEGDRLAIGEHTSVTVFDAASGKSVNDLNATRMLPLAVVWVRNSRGPGEKLVISDGDSELRIYDSMGKKPDNAWTTGRFKATTLAADPRSGRIATATADGAVQFWAPPAK